MPHTTTSCWSGFGVHLHLPWCPPTSDETVLLPVRAGHSVLLKTKKGPKICSPSSWTTVSHGLRLIYSFSITNPRQFIWQMIFPFGSFQCSLEGVKTRPKKRVRWERMRVFLLRMDGYRAQPSHSVRRSCYACVRSSLTGLMCWSIVGIRHNCLSPSDAHGILAVHSSLD